MRVGVVLMWVCFFQVTIDLDNFPTLKTDIDFTKQLLIEESVFCLPGYVSISPCRIHGYIISTQ